MSDVSENRGMKERDETRNGEAKDPVTHGKTAGVRKRDNYVKRVSKQWWKILKI